MTAFNHTPLPFGVAATAANVNVPLGELDAAIGRQNLSAVSDPTANDDSAAGYTVGSKWLNTSTGKMWMATDVTPGAAVWRLMELGAELGWTVQEISAGNINYVNRYIAVKNEGGAPTDDLVNIVGGQEGDEVFLAHTAGNDFFIQDYGNIKTLAETWVEPFTDKKERVQSGVRHLVFRNNNWHFISQPGYFDFHRYIKPSVIGKKFQLTKVSSTSWTTVFNTNIPSGVLGWENAVRIEAYGRYTGLNANSFSLDLLYGGSEVLLMRPSNPVITGSGRWWLTAYMHATGVINGQVCVGYMLYSHPQNDGELGMGTAAVPTFDQTLALRLKMEAGGGDVDFFGATVMGPFNHDTY